MESEASRAELDTSALPAGAQFDRWRRNVVGYDVSRPDDGGADRFEAKASAFSFGKFALVASTLDAASEYKGPRIGQPNNLSFVLVERGAIGGTVEGRRIDAGPGELTVFQWHREADVHVSPSTTLVLVAPLSAVAPALPLPPDLHGAPLPGLAGPLLRDFMRILHDRLRAADDAGRALLATATRSMLIACLSGLPRPMPAPRATNAASIRERAEAELRANIADPDFGPGALARAMGVTRSTLYRAFGDSGGIARRMRELRLDEAHRAIANAEDFRSIKAIAVAHGYRSVPHFNYAFREAYGYRPLDLRRSASRIAETRFATERPEDQLYEIVARLGR